MGCVNGFVVSDEGASCLHVVYADSTQLACILHFRLGWPGWSSGHEVVEGTWVRFAREGRL